MEALKKQASKLRQHVAKQQQVRASPFEFEQFCEAPITRAWPVCAPSSGIFAAPETERKGFFSAPFVGALAHTADYFCAASFSFGISSFWMVCAGLGQQELLGGGTEFACPL